MKVSSKVPAAAGEMSLSGYLARRFTYLPEAAWRRLIQDGRVSCNGVVGDLASTVRKGDTVCCDLPEFDAPPANLDYTVVYADDWLLAVNKPAGLRVHSGGKFVTANLVYHLRHRHRPAFPDACLVNRLDADTSGLVLLARQKRVLTELMRQFSVGAVTKSYLAVTEGCPDPAEGVISLPLGPVPGASVPRFGVDFARGKAAITRYRTLRTLSDGRALLALRPETGRTHQLRVHLAAIGHPIAGDALYTMSDAEYLAWQRNPPRQAGFKRQALHSHRLEFLHPVHREPCMLTAPLAPDLAQYLDTVGGSDESV